MWEFKSVHVTVWVTYNVIKLMYRTQMEGVTNDVYVTLAQQFI